MSKMKKTLFQIIKQLKISTSYKQHEKQTQLNEL